jgi:hypothetical protein
LELVQLVRQPLLLVQVYGEQLSNIHAHSPAPSHS